MIIKFEFFLNERKENNNHAILKNTGEKFWIGTINLLDNEIEEVHTYEEAESHDFHHSYYFSEGQLDKISEGECAIFWVDSDGVHGEHYNGPMGRPTIYQIKQQIDII